MTSIYAQGVLAGITMTGSLPYNFPSNMTPNMGARDVSSLGGLDGLVFRLYSFTLVLLVVEKCTFHPPPDQSSGYPTPRPGTAASDLESTYYMGRYPIHTVSKPQPPLLSLYIHCQSSIAPRRGTC